ncbi:MAG: COX15/CtaA family protein [Acidobacteriota bacterium]
MNRTTYTRLAWATLGANLGVILWGAYVRATGSGAGCGSHWPLCNGEVIPREPSVQTLIEYSHRLTSGIALLFVLALAIFAFRIFPKGHRVRWGATVTMILMLLEAGIGAGLVLFELVADNASMARAMFMGVHLGNTFLLLGALVVTAFWSQGHPAPKDVFRGPLATRFWASVVTMMLIGISGAIAALGDTLFPAESLLDGLRQDLSPTSHILIQLRVLHPFIAIGGSLVVFAFIGRLRAEKRPQPARKLATFLHFGVLAQLALGGINVMLLAPGWMQLVHLAVADALWIVLVLAGAAAFVEATADEPATVAGHATPSAA